MQFQVKVCGITRPRDAELAAKLGADLIGLIFYTGSPRCVGSVKANEIAMKLPPVIDTVGVFVDEKMTNILRLADKCRLPWVQLHGNYSSGDIEAIQRRGFRVIQAIQSSLSINWKLIASSAADLVMIDNSKGTGREYNFKPPRKPLSNFILSGGVSTFNLTRGVRLYRPVVVDVNSSVESKPGFKSKAKLTEFFRLCNELRYGI